MKKTILAALLCGLAGASLAQQAKVDPAAVEAAVKGMWAKAGPEWASSITPDETMKVCSETRNAPSAAEFEKIVAREKATVVFPADGNVMGDWKKGEIVASRGTGGQFTDTPDTYRGGNCYACHQLAAKEVSYGTLGPSLLGYGKARNFSQEEAKVAYAKIYNPQGVLACSQMPRFGHWKFLSEEQIKDAVAFLFHPDSPVNK
ncbi:MAG TPA: sulfur oxidation c-type cytochrome SoxX [Beijerinckiaceae bacterium]|nr:sulfur oxidation c-type cytochrome SoxX [Beijerinckiaceae bacterium]